MDQQLERIEKKLAELEAKLDATFRSSEKMRKYFLWSLILGIVVIVIPLLILPFVLPAFFNSLTLPGGF